jgi:hypothetical protein
MFDRLYLELQIALLLLSGAGIQGFTEWQCANMVNRTNRLVTDIFVALLEYKCGLPQAPFNVVEYGSNHARRYDRPFYITPTWFPFNR